MTETDEKWMAIAIDLARQAETIGEVPIGACVIDDKGELIATGFNRTISDSDPTSHAEIIAIRVAAAKVENYRLTGMTVYSTLEPCTMCAGALVTARIARVVFGAHDERFGGVDTHFGIGKGPELNHRIDYRSGVMAAECRSLLQNFFRRRRK